jgi:hypothetical protein
VSAEAPGALASAVCSITRTARGRFFWAAWWSRPPRESPFAPPDASSGGAATREEARAMAEQAAGRALTELEGRWARAVLRTLRGDRPWTAREEEARLTGAASARRALPERAPSCWSTLGVLRGASIEEIKRAYRAGALVAHPDRGGDAELFQKLTLAYERALERAARPRRR